jgi:hypothetical protein
VCSRFYHVLKVLSPFFKPLYNGYGFILEGTEIQRRLFCLSHDRLQKLRVSFKKWLKDYLKLGLLLHCQPLPDSLVISKNDLLLNLNWASILKGRHYKRGRVLLMLIVKFQTAIFVTKCDCSSPHRHRPTLGFSTQATSLSNSKFASFWQEAFELYSATPSSSEYSSYRPCWDKNSIKRKMVSTQFQRSPLDPSLLALELGF